MCFILFPLITLIPLKKEEKGMKRKAASANILLLHRFASFVAKAPPNCGWLMPFLRESEQAETPERRGGLALTRGKRPPGAISLLLQK